MIGLEQILRNRVEMLHRLDPEMTVEFGMDENDWGLITLRKGPWLLGVEVVETPASWSRHGPIVHYEHLQRPGRYMGIIVPEEAFCSLTGRLNGSDMELLCYDRSGNISPPLTLVNST
jgi:hypothetical protein